MLLDLRCNGNPGLYTAAAVMHITKWGNPRPEAPTLCKHAQVSIYINAQGSMQSNPFPGRFPSDIHKNIQQEIQVKKMGAVIVPFTIGEA